MGTEKGREKIQSKTGLEVVKGTLRKPINSYLDELKTCPVSFQLSRITYSEKKKKKPLRWTGFIWLTISDYSPSSKVRNL